VALPVLQEQVALVAIGRDAADIHHNRRLA
jgi:hypothetical protein